MATKEEMPITSEEEEDILQEARRDPRRRGAPCVPTKVVRVLLKKELGARKSYKDSVTRGSQSSPIEEEDLDDEGNVSVDVMIEEATKDDTWFGMGMSKEEKIVARRPWRNSLFIKLTGRTIGYHYL